MLKVSKRQWLSWHKWLALAAGWLFLLQALTGALLALEADIDGALNPDLLAVGQGPGAVSFGQAYASVQQAYPEHRVIFLQRPSDPHAVYEVVLDSITGKRVYVHSHTGEITGQRGAFSILKNLALILHTGILGGHWLEGLFGLSGVVVGVIVLMGLLAWWPKRWSRAWRVSFRSPTAFLITSHRVLGAALVLMIFPIICTGVLLSFHHATEDFAYLLTGAQRPAAKPNVHSVALRDYSAAEIDRMIDLAVASVNGQNASFIVLPRKPDEPISVRVRQPDGWHETGRSRAWLHPETQRILAAVDETQATATQRALDGLYPLHSGRIRGWNLQWLWFGAGLLSFLLALGGYWVWWLKRGKPTLR